MDPIGIVADHAGNVYVASGSTDSVFRIASSGATTRILDESGDGIGNLLDRPGLIAIDSSGCVYVGADGSDNVFRIGLGVAAIVSSNGSGQNPSILTSSAIPTLGGTWTGTLNCSAYRPGAAVLIARRASAVGTFTPFGEVLITGSLVFADRQQYSLLPSMFSWNVPNDMSMMGIELHIQGVCRETRTVSGKAMRSREHLSNALQLTLGF